MKRGEFAKPLQLVYELRDLSCDKDSINCSCRVSAKWLLDCIKREKPRYRPHVSPSSFPTNHPRPPCSRLPMLLAIHPRPVYRNFEFGYIVATFAMRVRAVFAMIGAEKSVLVQRELEF